MRMPTRRERWNARTPQSKLAIADTIMNAMLEAGGVVIPRKRMTLRIPPGLYRRILTAALADDISVNEWIVRALEATYT